MTAYRKYQLDDSTSVFIYHIVLSVFKLYCLHNLQKSFTKESMITTTSPPLASPTQTHPLSTC